jgi:hypothetical protein
MMMMMMMRSPSSSLLLLLGAVLLSSLLRPDLLCLASNPFSTNVIALNARNWRKEVEDSPHAVFVNICRQG